jgi:guanylate kinase
VAGPSGAGKGTLIGRALEKLEDVDYSVSATTRPIATGEIDGIDYHFVSDGRFDELVEADAFLEWEEVFGRRYGTIRSEVDRALSAGKDVLLELDVKGALTVKSKLKDALLIFIMPPTLGELETRLKRRSRDGERDINERTKLAPGEIEVGRAGFDVIIVNDDVDEAAAKLETALRGEKA